MSIDLSDGLWDLFIGKAKEIYDGSGDAGGKATAIGKLAKVILVGGANITSGADADAEGDPLSDAAAGAVVESVRNVPSSGVDRRNAFQRGFDLLIGRGNRASATAIRHGNAVCDSSMRRQGR